MEVFLTILAVLGGLLLFIVLLGRFLLKSKEKSKKALEARSKKADELIAIIMAKYKEVINEDFETRTKVISELEEMVEASGRHHRFVTIVLSRRGMNIGKSDEEREAEEQQGRIQREEKRLANYIADEYNKVIDKPEIIRKRRINQIAKDMDKSTDYVVSILRMKKCKDIPKV